MPLFGRGLAGSTTPSHSWHEGSCRPRCPDKEDARAPRGGTGWEGDQHSLVCPQALGLQHSPWGWPGVAVNTPRTRVMLAGTVGAAPVLEPEPGVVQTLTPARHGISFQSLRKVASGSSPLLSPGVLGWAIVSRSQVSAMSPLPTVPQPGGICAWTRLWSSSNAIQVGGPVLALGLVGLKRGLAHWPASSWGKAAFAMGRTVVARC